MLPPFGHIDRLTDLDDVEDTVPPDRARPVYDADTQKFVWGGRVYYTDHPPGDPDVGTIWISRSGALIENL